MCARARFTFSRENLLDTPNQFSSKRFSAAFDSCLASFLIFFCLFMSHPHKDIFHAPAELRSALPPKEYLRIITNSYCSGLRATYPIVTERMHTPKTEFLSATPRNCSSSTCRHFVSRNQQRPSSSRLSSPLVPGSRFLFLALSPLRVSQKFKGFWSRSFLGMSASPCFGCTYLPVTSCLCGPGFWEDCR